MKKHTARSRLSRRALWVQTLVFLVFLGLFLLLHLLTPDRGFSQMENRTLQTLPQFSLSTLFSGRFTEDFEDYISDQFAFRDTWTTLKARCELFIGKDQNKGIFLCDNDTLIEGFQAPETRTLDINTQAINTLVEHTDARVYLALIPSAAEVWRDMLPKGASNDSQLDVIRYVYDNTTAQTIDLYTPLHEHAEEPIYYRTDHHWTTLGAYYGYATMARAMNINPTPLDAYTPKTVTEQFYGSTYSSSGFSWVAPDSITTYVEQGDVQITNYPNGEPVEGTLYAESFLEVKDKYAYFYGGNTPLLEIDTGHPGPTLLIVRDSYTDSFSPFLFPHFSKICVVDLRYYRTSLQQYDEANDFDQILICYSVPNFSTDGNIFLVSR